MRIVTVNPLAQYFIGGQAIPPRPERVIEVQPFRVSPNESAIVVNATIQTTNGPFYIFDHKVEYEPGSDFDPGHGTQFFSDGCTGKLLGNYMDESIGGARIADSYQAAEDQIRRDLGSSTNPSYLETFRACCRREGLFPDLQGFNCGRISEILPLIKSLRFQRNLTTSYSSADFLRSARRLPGPTSRTGALQPLKQLSRFAASSVRSLIPFGSDQVSNQICIPGLVEGTSQQLTVDELIDRKYQIIAFENLSKDKSLSDAIVNAIPTDEIDPPIPMECAQKYRYLKEFLEAAMQLTNADEDCVDLLMFVAGRHWHCYSLYGINELPNAFIVKDDIREITPILDILDRHECFDPGTRALALYYAGRRLSYPIFK